MFKCKGCDIDARDGVKCSLCQGQVDFPCAGITEGGWRKFGDRRTTWKWANCKSSAATSPRIGLLNTSPTDTESILAELKLLSAQMEALPALVDNIREIQAELMEFKAIQSEFSELKSSMETVNKEMKILSCKVSTLEQEVENMGRIKEQISLIQARVEKLEIKQCESDQRSPINNIEIKGVPMSTDENLFSLIAKIGDTINCHIPKDQINYISRVPSRKDKFNRNIICPVHNSYKKA
ncbi:hypothetical protein HF086_011403 [Spodoptera exigua]|uniref:Uncharacterized protein n=1 Tax=Spodoptera exigua TaxID=7107 RepID=A0A922N0D6_SPOEX|nr:hypothetical protein HF086_011403 [Spodoptera exigua]